jgi:hypothetical protein
LIDKIQNTTNLCEAIDRLILAIESLHADLSPALKKTATLERRKQEVKEIETAASKAVAKWKDKKRNPISAIKH